jgi:nucleotide-binding universal stress UspA family protein
MYQVLIPVNDSESRAVHQAKYVSRLPRASESVEATVLHVSPPDGSDEIPTFGDVDAAVEAAATLEDAGVSVSRQVEAGGVSKEILLVADAEAADEIVIGGRKRSGVMKALLGSRAQDILLSGDRPVTVTGERVDIGDGVRQVLVPVDQSEERAHHQAEYVANLPGGPEAVEATVFLVFPHEDYEGAPPREFADVPAAVAAAEHLEDAGVAVDRVHTGGEITREIIEAADGIDADSIVMGGRKRSGVQKVLMGSTTQDVAISAEYPVTLTG